MNNSSLGRIRDRFTDITIAMDYGSRPVVSAFISLSLAT